jgi:hypothetical protein
LPYVRGVLQPQNNAVIAGVLPRNGDWTNILVCRKAFEVIYGH